MARDPLDEVLRLVAEGRLTADEAAPLLAALDASQPGRRSRSQAPGDRSSGEGAEARDGAEAAGSARGASRMRIEVREKGRSVLKLRLPIAVGRFALDRVPGLSGDQVERVREALVSGQRGPVLEIDDDGDGVVIVLE
jgi:hypothetical protein